MSYLKRLEPLWLALVIVAGLNWAIVALFDTNVVSNVLGGGTLTDIAYVAVGVAALTFVPRLLEGLRLGDRLPAHGH